MNRHLMVQIAHLGKKERGVKMKRIDRRKLFLGVVIVIVMFLVFLMMTLTAKADEFVTIKGYGPGEFAVKGEVERQANEIIKSWGKNKPNKIIIEGYADKTGTRAENDIVGRDRANEMKAFFENKTDAKIVARSKGDLENDRKVVITVEYKNSASTVANSNNKKTASNSFTKIQRILLASFGVALLVVLPILIYYSVKRRRSGNLQTEVKTKANAEESNIITVQTRWVEVESGSGKCMICVTKKSNNKWYTPFQTLEDGSKPLFRSEFQDAKKVVRGCAIDPRFADQFANLLAKNQEVKEYQVK